MHIILTGNTTFKLANFRHGLIRDLINNSYKVSVLAPPDEYVAAIRDLGCEFIPLQMDRNGTSALAETSLLLTMFRRIRETCPDVVLSYTIKNNIYAGITCRMLGIPFVPNVTGLGPSFNKRGFLNTTVRTLYRIAFNRAHTVFFQNEDDLATFTSANLCRESQVRLLPGSGVDLEKFRRSPMPDTADGIRFLLVSRLLWDKGIGIFADAAERLRHRYPRARFQLLGPLDPDSRSGIPDSQIQAWAAQGAIEYLGSTRDVLPFLEAAHCVVLPSFYREGTPRSLLEACAVGRPIITTDMPGCRDVVENGRNGFLIKPDDTEELMNACKYFSELSHEEMSAMGNASRYIAENRYDENIVISSYNNIISDISNIYP